MKNVKKSDIIILQDGAFKAVEDVVKKHGLKLIQNTQGLNLRGGMAPDGAARIAMHYKFALTTAFNTVLDAPAIIIIEDDLLFSPDFYDYFLYNAPILDADSSVMIVSAWHDNGFKERVTDPYSLQRSEFFPGLGWLLTRKLYKEELEPAWPMEHWDHWLRSVTTSKNREIGILLSFLLLA